MAKKKENKFQIVLDAFSSATNCMNDEEYLDFLDQMISHLEACKEAKEQEMEDAEQ